MTERFEFTEDKSSHSKIDWDYYSFYLMIIHTFGEMLFHLFRNKGRVPSQTMVSLYQLLHTCKRSYVTITAWALCSLKS